MKRNILKSAKIRNSQSCPESENIIYSAIFDTDRDVKGWDFTENISLYGVSNGLYFFSADADAPALSRSTTLANIDSSKYTEIVIKFQYKINRDDSIATEGKIQFTTSSDSLFNDDKSITFQVYPDDEWHTYYIDMAEVTEWVGYITNLKIFFVTNGKKDDEIFLRYIKIQQPQFIFCTESCYGEVSETLLGINFDIEDYNNVPQNFSISDSSVDKTVLITHDPDNSVNNVMSLNKTVSGTIGPSASRMATSSSLIGFFSCRFRVTSLDGELNLKTDLINNTSAFIFRINSNNKLSYKSGPSFVDFTTEHSIEINRWYNLLVNFNLDSGLSTVYLDDILLSTDIPYLDLGPIEAVSFSIPNINICQFFIDDILLVDQKSIDLNCYGIGKRGEIKGIPVLFTYLTIEQGINDSLVVNINNFGDVIIYLPEVTSASTERLRILLQNAINQIDLGGYVQAEVVFIDGSFKIRSGTYGFDSNVSIKKHGDSTLSEDLGFTLSNGDSIGTTSIGRPHAQNFKFSYGFSAPNRILNGLINEEDTIPLHQDPRKSSVEIGSITYDRLGKKNYISGSNKTFIDYHHRATSEGYINTIWFQGRLPGTSEVKATGSNGQANGTFFNTGLGNLQDLGVVEGDVLVIDEPGYEGNGSYSISFQGSSNLSEGYIWINDSRRLPVQTQLSFSIHNIAKVKQFRPSKDGTLNLINESVIGSNDIAGQLYTRTHDSHQILVNWYVHRGDLIAIYNPAKVFLGQDTSGLTSNQYKDLVGAESTSILRKEGDPAGLADALYLEYLGDLTEPSILSTIKGQGILGIGLYGSSGRYQTKAIYDIELDNNMAVEYVEVHGNQLDNDIEYNILTAVGNGVSIVAVVTGTHTHILIDPDDPLAVIPPVIHNNIAYNISALSDGLKLSENGFLGEFEEDISGASYFYIDGDAEFAGYLDAEGNEVDSLEFPEPTPYEYSRTVDYETDPFNLVYSWSAKKYIHRYRMFFKEYPNAEGYSLEYKTLNNRHSDGVMEGFELIGNGNPISYSKVVLDTLLLTPDTLQSNDVFNRHFNKTFIGFTGPGNIQDASTMQIFRRYPYTVLDKTFTDVQTTALNWTCLNHKSTKISEVEVYSKTNSKTFFGESIELYFETGDSNFQRVTGEKINDNIVRFYINFPTKYIRVVVEPDQEISFSSITATTSDDVIRYKEFDTGKPLDTIDIPIEKGTFSAPYHIQIQNKTGSLADVEISIDVDEIYKDILLKTNLNNNDEVLNPEIGPPGFLIQDDNFDLPTINNVAINAKAFGLKNLAEFKPYYITDQFNDESDYFQTHVNISKWDKFYSSFPQTSPSNLGEVFPGFSIDVVGSGSVQPNTAQPNILAELRSRWKVVGSFSASIQCIYDARGSLANPMGSQIGIIDSTGRRLYIRKRRRLYTQSSQTRESSQYEIIDDITTLSTVTNYCLNISAICPIAVSGTRDDFVEYGLSLTRLKTDSYDLLRFSYLDTVNGTGQEQWSMSDYFQIDLHTLSTPLVGDIKIFIRNEWSKALSPASVNGTPGVEGSFVRVNRFNFGGESTYTKSYIFEPVQQIGISGAVNVDNKHTTLTSSTEGKYVAVDLGRRYNIDIFDIYSNNGNLLWNKTYTQYSNSDINDPNTVVWGNSTKSDCRWLLFTEVAVPTTYSGTLKYLDYIRVYPDITTVAPEQLTNSEWEDLGTVLTDNNKNTYITQVDYPVFAIRLANQFDLINFKLLNRQLVEYDNFDIFSLGWTPFCDFTVSDHITNLPQFITNWAFWDSYPTALIEQKITKPTKWLAFRNTSFNTDSGSNSVKHYVSEFTATTRGLRSDQTGQRNDRVDFTEYSEWYDISFSYQQNVARISEDLLYFAGSLYSVGTLKRSLGESISKDVSAFDNDPNTTTILTSDSPYLWRVFGVPLEVSQSGFTTTLSGSEGFFVVSGEADPIFEVSYYNQTVDAVEISVPNDAPGIPNSLSLQVLSGTDPTNELHWFEIYAITDIATIITVDGKEELEFNGGEPLSLTFNPPLSVSGMRVDITDVTYLREVDKSVAISEFKILQNLNQNNSNIVNISKDDLVGLDGYGALKITYLSGNSSSVKITTGGAFNIEPDINWSIQDYFAFHLQIDKPDLLDYENSYIRLGNDSENAYKWRLDKIQPLITSGVLSQQLLKFLDAEDRFQEVNNYQMKAEDFQSSIDFTKSITFFELEIKPSGMVLEDINIWLDDCSIVRENFTASGTVPTLYLNNSELLYYPMTNFNIKKGFFEATITPDWDQQVFDISNIEHDTVFTIFTALNGINESFSCFYDSRFGLTFSSVNVDGVKTHLTSGFIRTLIKYKPIKISIAWDSEGSSIDAKVGSTIRVWVDDQVAGDFTTQWSLTQTKDTYFFIGSKSNLHDVGLSTLENYATTVPIKIVPITKSLHGAIEDLIIASKPKKIFFEELQSLKDRIYLSIDGINYYNGSDPLLPFLLYNIGSGDYVDLWIKTNLPIDTRNLQREGFLKARWRVV